jgi:carboxylesterase type B
MNLRRGLGCWIGAVLLWALPGALAQPASPDCAAGPVATAGGAVCGKVLEQEGRPVFAFLGIPYAESPAGANRWKPPVPKAVWEGRRQATEFGPICPQNFEAPGLPEQSEDCLSLNVWTPDLRPQPQGLPVLVYVHGGAFKLGSSAARIYDGANLAARHGMVVVSFNYRLGALGFLAGVSGLQGNYGLLDQQLALQWVRQNVRAFGGDPDRVTLAGESAGATSVGLHALSMPASRPLFRSVILMSNPLGIPLPTLAQARRTALSYLVATGCDFKRDTLECLRSRPLEAILKAEQSRLLGASVLTGGLANLLTWSPVLDGTVVREPPLEAARRTGLDKPALIGTNADEGILFIAGLGQSRIGLFAYHTLFNVLLGDAGRAVANRYAPGFRADYRQPLEAFVNDYLFHCPARVLAGSAKAPVYLYRFTHPNSLTQWPGAGCAGKACHSDGMPFVFNTLEQVGTPSPAERELAREMGDYIGQFVNGQPLRGARGLEWPAYTPQDGSYLRFDTPTELFRPQDPNCAFLDEVGYPPAR